MKTLQRKRILGFTLIELMIVVGIVAILLAIAYPSYAQYVRKAKRGDAQQLLLNWSINQEIFRSNNTTYADVDDLPAPTHDDYILSLDGAPTATTYTVQAVARNDQVNDKAKDGTDCSPLKMDQNGVKLPANCWN
jgi:type IV pilus assembly protein PilE